MLLISNYEMKRKRISFDWFSSRAASLGFCACLFDLTGIWFDGRYFICHWTQALVVAGTECLLHNQRLLLCWLEWAKHPHPCIKKWESDVMQCCVWQKSIRSIAILWKDGATIGPAHEYWALSLTMSSSKRWPTLINSEDEELHQRLAYT